MEKEQSIYGVAGKITKEYGICHSREEQHPSDIWFAICNEDTLIGIAGLHNLKYIQGNAEIAILIGEPAYRNKKIGRYVLKLIEEYAFGTLALHRLYVLVYSDNLHALHFFEKCRWEQEGTLKEASYWNYRFRDVVIWAKLTLADRCKRVS